MSLSGCHVVYDDSAQVSSVLTRLDASESNDTHWPLELIDGPWLSPLASTPPGPMLIRSTESIVGGAPAADGVSVVRKMSVFPLLSFGTRLLAAEAHATRTLLLAVSTATARLVHFPAFCALHCRELPVGRTFRSPPASGMLIRSNVPAAALATGPPRAASSATAPASAAACWRRPKPDDRGVLMAGKPLHHWLTQPTK